MSAGGGINFGVPGAEGSVGGGANYFYYPTPGDVKVSVQPSRTLNPLPIALARGEPVCAY